MTLDLNFFGRQKVPVILQSELAECGLASLAMVAGYHGLDIDLAYLRRKWSVSVKGTALSQIIEMSRHLSLTPRALRLEPERLHDLNTPSILHWEMDHFVVLEKVSRRGLTIVDPALGRRIAEPKEVREKFTGVALELVPATGFEKEKRRSDLKLRHLLTGSRGLAGALLQIFAFSLAIQVFALSAPFYSQIVIDDVVVSGDVSLLNLVLIVFATIKLLQIATTALRSWVIVYLGMKIKLIWSSRLFFHLIRLPMSYFDARHIGDIQSRYGSLIRIQELVTTKFVETVVDGLMTITTVVVLFLYDPFLASIVLASSLIYLGVKLSIYPRLMQRAKEAIIAYARKETYFLETIRGLLTVKNFGMEHRRETSFQNKVVDTINSDVRVARIGIVEITLSQLIFSVQFLLIVWLAAGAILNGNFTVGMLVAFLAYRAQFSERSALLVDRLIEFRLSRVHLDRLADIIETDAEAGLTGPAVKEAKASADIQRIDARNIWYRYADTEPYVLQDVSFNVDAGEYVVITGPSGFGKTTLLKLLMGIFVPSRGEILIDGLPIHNFGIQRYRQAFSSVMQDDALLAGTLIENISFFDPLVDTKRVEECAEMACIANDIARMPMQYFTLVGDMGAALSGGQKQRILLARALYKRPGILFLDEASSHLDTENEQRVIATLQDLNITIVGVAHRTESVRRADRVIDIESLPGEAVRLRYRNKPERPS